MQIFYDQIQFSFQTTNHRVLSSNKRLKMGNFLQKLRAYILALPIQALLANGWHSTEYVKEGKLFR